MITVWCMCWGDKYPDYYVLRLQREVKQNLSLEHQFKCITDRHIEGVETVIPVVDWPGWWGKIQLFKPGFTEGVNLWLDLDVVITGNLKNILYELNRGDLAAASNWAKSGHGGIQSSVMVWIPNQFNEQIYTQFKPGMAHWPPRNEAGILWGDQEWITTLRDSGQIVFDAIHPRLIQSYKYHCRDGLPVDTAVVVFHGDPKPADVKESWFEW